MTPHKHAELIKQWADGAQIQYQCVEGPWYDTYSPNWDERTKYRVKPAPIVKKVKAVLDSSGRLALGQSFSIPYNLSLTFDPDTHELVDAEVMGA